MSGADERAAQGGRQDGAAPAARPPEPATQAALDATTAAATASAISVVTSAAIDAAIDAAVERLAAALVARGWMLATAESCTGGLIAAACTARAGSSMWFERGFVTYSNAAKSESIGVDAALIAAHGAVSREVACAMAAGALGRSAAQVALAVTGVAGPGGGSLDKPIGTVWIAWQGPASPAQAERFRFDGDRAEVRSRTVLAALQGALRRVG